jgi:hypothetical protein
MRSDLRRKTKGFFAALDGFRYYSPGSPDISGGADIH